MRVVLAPRASLCQVSYRTFDLDRGVHVRRAGGSQGRGELGQNGRGGLGVRCPQNRARLGNEPHDPPAFLSEPDRPKRSVGIERTEFEIERAKPTFLDWKAQCHVG